MVEVNGVGQKFSGTYRVATSTHVLRGGGTYETHVRQLAVAHDPRRGRRRRRRRPGLRRAARARHRHQQRRPRRHGPRAGAVPGAGDDAEGAWARIASVERRQGTRPADAAGRRRGGAVGFEHGDTTRPYVLGSLFNGNDTPGDDLLQEKDGSFALKSDQKITSRPRRTTRSRATASSRRGQRRTSRRRSRRDWTSETTARPRSRRPRPSSSRARA